MSIQVSAASGEVLWTHQPSFYIATIAPSLVTPSATAERNPGGTIYASLLPGPSQVTHLPNKPNIGAIVGGVVGGLALISIIAGGLYWRRQRRHAKRHSLAVVAEPPVDTVPEPPSYDASRWSVESLQKPVYKGEGLDEKDVKVYKFEEKRVDAWPADKKT